MLGVKHLWDFQSSKWCSLREFCNKIGGLEKKRCIIIVAFRHNLDFRRHHQFAKGDWIGVRNLPIENKVDFVYQILYKKYAMFRDHLGGYEDTKCS